MKETLLHKLEMILTDFVDKFGLFVIGGIIGAIIDRFRNTMSLINFGSVIVTSAFVGVIVGIMCRNYLNVNEEVTFAIVSTIGVFSKDFLDLLNDLINELREIIQKLSVFVTKFINKKIENK